jgi:hypothetical protein
VPGLVPPYPKNCTYKTKNGKLKTENRKRKTENGKRKTENGKRKTENGNRKTENGKRKTETYFFRSLGASVDCFLVYKIGGGGGPSQKGGPEKILCHPNPT